MLHRDKKKYIRNQQAYQHLFQDILFYPYLEGHSEGLSLNLKVFLKYMRIVLLMNEKQKEETEKKDEKALVEKKEENIASEKKEEKIKKCKVHIQDM